MKNGFEIEMSLEQPVEYKRLKSISKRIAAVKEKSMIILNEQQLHSFGDDVFVEQQEAMLDNDMIGSGDLK